MPNRPLLLLLLPVAPRAQRAPDWNALQTEAIATIQSYVRINTSNPPGDVTRAADVLVAILQREGVPVDAVGPAIRILYEALIETVSP